MKLKKLCQSFYQDNPVVRQALDFDMKTNSWMGGDKVRGHGIVSITFNDLLFAIPARSNVIDRNSFILDRDKSSNKYILGMGLDYTKALLIRDGKYILDEEFKLKKRKLANKLIEKQEHISQQFSKYVQTYIHAISKNDSNIIKRYKYSTLQNYHQELGLE